MPEWLVLLLGLIMVALIMFAPDPGRDRRIDDDDWCE
jgi:hypothetical protein